MSVMRKCSIDYRKLGVISGYELIGVINRVIEYHLLLNISPFVVVGLLAMLYFYIMLM